MAPVATWITPYGPEGKPGRMPPGTAVGKIAPGIAVGAARPGVTVGRFRAGVAVGTPGVGESVGGSVAGSAVGVDRRICVGKGVGVPTKESVQALRLSMAILAVKRKRVRFISLSFLLGVIPPC